MLASVLVDPSCKGMRYNASLSASRRARVAVLLAVAANGAWAHEYYLSREGDELVLYQGHVQSRHEGAAVVPYEPVIVREALCVGVDGGASPLPIPTSYPARLPGDCAALWLRTSTGYWSQTAAGEVNRPKTEVPDASYAWWSEESLKHVATWASALTEPLGESLELVPIDNPLTVARGGKVRLRVTWRGAPLAGVPVAYDGDVRGVTDAGGEINIRLQHGGRQLIAASFEETLVDDTRSDAAVRTTALQFQAAE